MRSCGVHCDQVGHFYVVILAVFDCHMMFPAKRNHSAVKLFHYLYESSRLIFMNCLNMMHFNFFSHKWFTQTEVRFLVVRQLTVLNGEKISCELISMGDFFELFLKSTHVVANSGRFLIIDQMYLFGFNHNNFTWSCAIGS